ncbi:HYR-like domain-containing protein, partial [Maribellus mangrovi]|uniref:HYR-like domain-containing protein n=1 Tax=Maribellus mangrovi TaxID=3133146 RepID=UPI003F58F80D
MRKIYVPLRTARVLLSAVLTGIMLFTTSVGFGQTVTTDKTDYFPGDVVFITGSGWLAGETVLLVIDHQIYDHPNDTLYAVADDIGDIDNHEFQIEEWDLGEAFLLTAKGLSSLLEATTTFTDGQTDIYDMDFTAAAPYTYDHETGGGAFNDRTVGKYDDIVESLEGGDFKCGDVVTYLMHIVTDPLEDAEYATETIELDFSFLATTTGQPGIGHEYIKGVAINYNTDFVGTANDGDPDTGISDNHDSEAELMTDPYLLSADGNNLLATIQIDSLNPGEEVVLRIDVVIECVPGSDPTGNLQATLDAAHVIWGIDFNGVEYDLDNAIPGSGAQTVPFKSIGDIIQYAKIIVVKDAVPDNAQDFRFSFTNGVTESFSLDDDADATLSNTKEFVGLLPGTYVVEEIDKALQLPPLDWGLTNITYEGYNIHTGPITPDVTTAVDVGTATINIDWDQVITVTFTNESKASCVPPPCDITGNDPVCPGATETYSYPFAVDGLLFSWSISGAATISGDTDGPSVVVVADKVCDQTFTLTVRVTRDDDPTCFTDCSLTVTIEDHTPPVVTPPTDDLTMKCFDADLVAAWAAGASANDLCDGAVDVDFSYIPPTSNCNQEIIVSFYAEDFCTNGALATKSFIVNDDEPPVLTGCPDGVTVECDNIPNPANVTATDNCDADVTLTFTEARTEGDCGLILIERTWTATDACGNVASCTQLIKVEDTTPPVIVCPPDVTVECDESTDPDNTGYATATDNCDNQVVITWADDEAIGSCGLTSIERTWTATDCDGNAASCIQIITVVDTKPPVIKCPADATVECDVDNSPTATGYATATDNCDNDVEITWADVTTDGDCGLALIERTWTAKDCDGNISTCVQTIKVVDTTPPVILCPKDATVECDESTDPSATGFATATDNCDNEVEVAYSDEIAAGDCPQESVITRTWTATDCHGNSVSCDQIITVRDNVPPSISCPADVVFDCKMGDPGTATVSDNCDENPALSYSDVGSLDDCGYGTITRTWRATDCAGNFATCVQTITVRDNVPPSISCPADVVFDCKMGDP